MDDYYIEVLNSKGVWCKVLRIFFYLKFERFYSFSYFKAVLIDLDKDGVLIKYDDNNNKYIKIIICILER